MLLICSDCAVGTAWGTEVPICKWCYNDGDVYCDKVGQGNFDYARGVTTVADALPGRARTADAGLTAITPWMCTVGKDVFDEIQTIAGTGTGPGADAGGGPGQAFTMRREVRLSE